MVYAKRIHRRPRRAPPAHNRVLARGIVNVAVPKLALAGSPGTGAGD